MAEKGWSRMPWKASWGKSPIDEPDHRYSWEKPGVFAPAALEPRGDVPVAVDWEVMCGLCGELDILRLTEAAAEAYARQLVREHARCGRCLGGWLSMGRMFGTRRPGAGQKPDQPDTLSGPPREMITERGKDGRIVHGPQVPGRAA